MRKRRVHATIMITVIVVAVVSGMLKWQLDAQAQRKEIARYEACQAQYLSTGIKLFEFGTTTDEYGNTVPYLDAETGDNATHLQQALDAYNADPKTTESVSYEEAALALRDDFIAVANHKAGKVSDFWIWGFTAPNLVSTDTGPTPTGNLLLPGDKDYDHPSCNFNYLAGDALLAGRFELWWKSETYARTGGWCLRQMGAVTVEVQPYGSHATSYSGGIVNGDTVDSYDLQAIEQGKDPLDHPEKDGTVTPGSSTVTVQVTKTLMMPRCSAIRTAWHPLKRCRQVRIRRHSGFSSMSLQTSHMNCNLAGRARARQACANTLR